MGMVIEFILTHKSLFIIGLLSLALAGMGVYVKILKSETESAEAKVSVIQGELEVSQASVKSLQQAIVDQNAAVDKLKSDADARVAAHQVEIVKAQNVAAGYKKQAQDLLKAKIPQGKQACDAANDLINQEIRNAK